jgi:hypothetical protein
MTDSNCTRCLKKLTVRNYITIATVTVFLALVVYAVVINQVILENPIITFLLGTFVSVVTMIYQFYYRKNKTKREYDEKYTFEDGDDICPCCDQKIRNIKG